MTKKLFNLQTNVRRIIFDIYFIIYTYEKSSFNIWLI